MKPVCSGTQQQKFATYGKCQGRGKTPLDHCSSQGKWLLFIASREELFGGV
jgi:hypothetical protein